MIIVVSKILAFFLNRIDLDIYIPVLFTKKNNTVKKKKVFNN